MTSTFSNIGALKFGFLAVSFLSSTVGSTALSAAQILPSWQPSKICAADSAQGQCVLFEVRARNDVTASWSVIPADVRDVCVARFSTPLEPSWRILGDCIEIEGRKAQLVKAEAGFERESNALKALAAVNAGKPAAVKAIPNQDAPRSTIEVQPTTKTIQIAQADSEAERKRLADEEASFMATLAAQRKADAEAAERAAAAKKAAEAGKAAAAAEAERKRLADEEASFMATLAAQRKADAEAAARAAAAKKAAETGKTAAAAEAERKRLADEEASFMATLAAQRKADEEAAKKAAAAKEGATAAKRQVAATSCQEQLKQITSTSVIQFTYNSAALADATGAATLDRLAAAISKCEGQLTILVEGHTDSMGTEAGNVVLSNSRAETVAEFLRSKGVTADRISAKGFGASKPIATNATRAGRAKNRRIEFKVQ